MLMLLIVTEGVHREIEEKEKWGKVKVESRREGGERDDCINTFAPSFLPLSLYSILGHETHTHLSKIPQNEITLRKN